MGISITLLYTSDSQLSLNPISPTDVIYLHQRTQVSIIYSSTNCAYNFSACGIVSAVLFEHSVAEVSVLHSTPLG